MKLLNTLAIATTITTLGLSSPVWADYDSDSKASNTNSKKDSSATHSEHKESSKFQSSRSSMASDIIGMEVRNQQDEKLGSIKDLIVDLRSGKANYAILSTGGLLGLGDRLVAIPVSQLKRLQDENQLVLNIDKERLNNAPQFDENAFASNSTTWDREIQKFHTSKTSSSKSYGSKESKRDYSLEPTGKSSSERSSSSMPSENKSDSSIAQDVKKKLNDDSSLSKGARDVDVDVKNGVVTLRGTVASESEKNAIAAKVGQCCGGAHKVINQLEVK